LLALGDVDRVLADFATALTLGDKSATTYVGRAQAFEQKSTANEAIAAYRSEYTGAYWRF
jgi:hypothetical protein